MKNEEKSDKKSKKIKKITLKQRKWLALYMASGNATQAVIEAYGLDPVKQYNTAKSIGWENLTKLDMEIIELLDEAGVTDSFLTRKLIENLDATKLFGKQGIEHPDFPARNKALEIGFKLRGRLRERVDVNQRGNGLETSTEEVAKALQAILSEDDDDVKEEENQSDHQAGN